MSCPKCADHHLIAIGVNLGLDEVTMRSCPTCGERWWETQGHPVPLPRVLELAASSR